MKDKNIFVRVDRIQSYEGPTRIHNPVKKHHNDGVWYAGGKSNKDIHLEQRAQTEALRLEFRL